MLNGNNIKDAFIVLHFLKKHIYDRFVNFIILTFLTQILILQYFLYLFTKPILKILQFLIKKNTYHLSNPNMDLWNFIMIYMNFELLLVIPYYIIWIPHWLFGNIIIDLILITIIQLILLSFFSVRVLNIYAKEDFKTLNCYKNISFNERYEKIKNNCGVNNENLLDIAFVYLLTTGSHLYPYTSKLFGKYRYFLLDYFENYELYTVSQLVKTIVDNPSITNTLIESLRGKFGNEKNKMLFIGKFTSLNNNNNNERNENMIPITPKVNYKFPSLNSINSNEDDNINEINKLTTIKNKKKIQHSSTTNLDKSQIKIPKFEE